MSGGLWAAAAKTDERTCWRCGVTFDGLTHYVSNAPCKDCRQFLRTIDGETTTWRGSCLEKAVRTFRTAPVPVQEQAYELFAAGHSIRGVQKALGLGFQRAQRFRWQYDSRQVDAA